MINLCYLRLLYQINLFSILYCNIFNLLNKNMLLKLFFRFYILYYNLENKFTFIVRLVGSASRLMIRQRADPADRLARGVSQTELGLILDHWPSSFPHLATQVSCKLIISIGRVNIESLSSKGQTGLLTSCSIISRWQ